MDTPDIDQESESPERTRAESLCPCKSMDSYYICCMPLHRHKAKAKTAEELMRSRYAAYFFRLTDYLVETTHPDTREPELIKELNKTIHDINWYFLTVDQVVKGGKNDKNGKVEFTARCYIDGEAQELHERARFKRYKGDWKYLAGKAW